MIKRDNQKRDEIARKLMDIRAAVADLTLGTTMGTASGLLWTDWKMLLIQIAITEQKLITLKSTEGGA